jgi:hypothetical protein
MLEAFNILLLIQPIDYHLSWKLMKGSSLKVSKFNRLIAEPSGVWTATPFFIRVYTRL